MSKDQRTSEAMAPEPEWRATVRRSLECVDDQVQAAERRADEARSSRIRIIAEAAHRFLESRPLVVEAHLVPVRSGREMQLEDLCCWFESVCTELEQAGGPRPEPAVVQDARWLQHLVEFIRADQCQGSCHCCEAYLQVAEHAARETGIPSGVTCYRCDGHGSMGDAPCRICDGRGRYDYPEPAVVQSERADFANVLDDRERKIRRCAFEDGYEGEEVRAELLEEIQQIRYDAGLTAQDCQTCGKPGGADCGWHPRREKLRKIVEES